MNQLHYDYIQQRNERILKSILVENELHALQSRRISLRVRFLFLLSDILLTIGAWIRPDEIRVFVHEHGLEESTPLTNCT